MEVTKVESHDIRQKIARAKSYSDMQETMGDLSGEEELQAIVNALEERPPREHRMLMSFDEFEQSPDEYLTVTPQGTQNPEPPGSGAPFLPHDFGKTLLPFPNYNATTPTPSGI
jgi:tRNA-dihydrouridine synthase 2